MNWEMACLIRFDEDPPERSNSERDRGVSVVESTTSSDDYGSVDCGDNSGSRV